MRHRLSLQFMAAIVATQVLVLSLALVVQVWHECRRTQTELLGQARVLAQQLVAVRSFIARNQDRINRDRHGNFEFKGLNPAAVGRGVNEAFARFAGYRFKQTRLHVRNPANAPDAFEREALMAFLQDRGLREYHGRVNEGGRVYFRYAIPLRVEPECLQCHGEPRGSLDVAGYLREGYRLGDLGGAISVSIPMDRALAELRTSLLWHVTAIVVLIVLSLGLIYTMVRRLVAGPLEQLAGLAGQIGGGRFDVDEAGLAGLRRYREVAVLTDALLGMARRLGEAYGRLEQKVAERTAQLRAANAELEAKNEELARANRLQSEFLTMVSHEFRTPLTSILAFTEMLQRGAGGRLTPEQRGYLADVAESGQRLLGMVNNLLDFSRLEAGRIRLFTEAIDVADALGHAVQTVRPLAAEKAIRLEVRPAPDLPLVLADPLRVEQVLLNLLGNAIKFTPRGGEIRVGADSLPGEDGASGWVRFWVEDTGPGVPPEERETIFEAFRQGDSGGRHPGTGLGLALSRSLVQLHGGHIGVEDARGGGSRFWFTLPALRADPDEREEKQA